MNYTQHNRIVSFIWGIADDVLRDVYTRGKYRDIILPFTVLRRLDALLEPTKKEVLDMHSKLNELKIDNQGPQLRKVTKYVFYNTSPFTFKTLLNDPGNIRINLETYLDGFSTNVQDIISKFKLRNQLDTMEEGNITFPLIEKFCSSQINLSPEPIKNSKGEIIQDGLSNLGMGYVFEELIRKFNEENNEEAGEHFTPREIIKLMTHLIFEPIKDKIKDGTYLIYDPACGSGGMLTEAERFAQEINPSAKFHLYGQEVSPETYAICKADMLINGEDPEKVAFGSTLSRDGFPSLEFDFMLSNPPYGKSWKVDYDSIVEKDGNKKEIVDSRFKIGIPRTSDGQLLFLMNMVSKMKKGSALGTRIASIHNGSSLATGDAGQGESEIRKHLLENDLIECIIQLPQNMFYNTNIETYIWLLNNKKDPERKNKVQLVDASELYERMNKSLGEKNKELLDIHIDQIVSQFLNFKESKISKIFDTQDFGYHKITVERPLRLAWDLETPTVAAILSKEKYVKAISSIKNQSKNEDRLDYNHLVKLLNKFIKESNGKWSAKEKKEFLDTVSYKNETAKEVIAKIEKDDTIIFQADNDLKDYEYVPFKDDIEEYFKREVLPYYPDAWINHEKTISGYEIGFTKIFFKHSPLRKLEKIEEEIQELEEEKQTIELYNEKTFLLNQKDFNSISSDSKFWPNIPSSWKIEKAKHIFQEFVSKNHPEEDLLAATQDRGVLPKYMCEQNFVSPSDDKSGLKLVEQHDFVISLRSFQGGIEYSAYRGIISPAYTVIRLKKKYNTSEYISYYRYLFKSPQLIALLNTAISGIRDGKNINWSDFCNLQIPVPNKEDILKMQEIFNRYETLVSAQRRELLLMEEYKNTLIAKATSGQLEVGLEESLNQ